MAERSKTAIFQITLLSRFHGRGGGGNLCLARVLGWQVEASTTLHVSPVIRSTLTFIFNRGRRGPVGLFVNNNSITAPRVEGSNLGPSSFFYFVNVPAANCSRERQVRSPREERRERRQSKDERPAGVSGMDLREWFGSF